MPYTRAEMRNINGFKPRPPKKWWIGMRKIVRKAYKNKSEKQINRITAGIWHNFSAENRRYLIKKFSKSRTYFKRK